MERCRMMKRRRKMEVCSVILPRQIWIEILLRLPVKSLARFKCVSKSWLSLISDPYFARSHFDLALAPTHTILLSSDGCREIASIHFNAQSLRHYSTQILNPPNPILSDVDRYKSLPRIIGSCRGFVLVDFDPDLYIWNPCTGVQTIIPSLPSYVDPQRVFLCGFGYDASTDDYLITLGSYKGRQCSEIRVLIFSVRANQWKPFDGIIPDTLKYRRVASDPGGLFFNGAIHWMSRDHGHKASVVGADVIVAFDLAERVFFEIALPDSFKFDFVTAELHLVIGGFLSVCPCSWNSFDDKLLVMEEYNRVQSSWKRLCFSNHDWLLHPLCVTVGGDVLAIDSDFRELVKLNGKGQVLESCDYHDYPDPHPGARVVYMHTHSLLSLPCQAKDI